MLELTLEAYGETIIKRRLLRFEHGLVDPKEGFEEVAALLRAIVEVQFETEGGHASGGWPKLAESTVKRKARLGQDPHILRATDRLREALTRKFDPEHIERLSEDSLTFGATVPYGIYHQSSRPRTKLPFRPPIALTEGDKRDIVKTFQKSLREAMEAVS